MRTGIGGLGDGWRESSFRSTALAGSVSSRAAVPVLTKAVNCRYRDPAEEVRGIHLGFG
ncbi:hypothetical protein FHX34_103425 [Actinoplanes teichomyceticus]|uniref:Uncharacterized protein n=1 Tax=Actinoplanes teichomyceticus TaxID=1867 RepID=A0A561WAK8_ACTTI|nr:hypothetical protein FHX34_103425 [Actinoplanes teichomyceticus]